MTGIARVATSGRLSGAELRERARALIPRIAAAAEETDKARMAPADIIAAMREAGLLRLLQPARYGGHEAELGDFIDILFEFGAACGSIAWVYGVLTSHSMSVATFSEQAQDEVWGDDPEAVAASGFMPTAVATKVDGGYVMGGRWPFSSGCDHAQWVLLGARVEYPAAKEGPPLVITTLVPMGDVGIDDDWHVIGLAGTGSKSIVGKDIFVPDHRALPFPDSLNGTTPGADLHPGELYRCPRQACAPFSLAAVPVGIAQGAVDIFVDYMTGRETRGKKLAELTTLQVKVAECDAELDAARVMLHRDASMIHQTLRAGGQLTVADRVRVRRDHAFACKLATQAVDRVYTAVGAHGLYDSHPLQRRFRDVHAAAGQIALNWDVCGSLYGQARLGVTPDATAF